MAKLIRVCPACGDRVVVYGHVHANELDNLIALYKTMQTREICLKKECGEWNDAPNYGWEGELAPRAKVPTMKVWDENKKGCK